LPQPRKRQHANFVTINMGSSTLQWSPADDSPLKT
jgi:hypothetical protein